MKVRLNSTVAAATVLSMYLAISATAAMRYVNMNNATPTPPYTNWVSAATNIQDAIDVAVAGDEIVVTNGVYATGGRVVFGAMTNRVAVTKAVIVRSVNGPAVTVIEGYQVPGTINGDSAVRCVYLAEGAVLVGFTLTNGATRSAVGNVAEISGGGALGGITTIISNCVLTGNSAHYAGGGAFECTLNNCMLTGNSADYGGGAMYCTMINCTLTNNSASSGGGGVHWSTLNNCNLAGNSAQYGGGADGGTLNNCTVMGNSADHGGGAYAGTLNNCTVTGNFAREGGGAIGHTPSGPRPGLPVFCILNNCIVCYNTADSGGSNYGAYSTLNYSCTTPLPTNGVGNITNEPAFVDLLNGNLRLRLGSPCVDAGTNLSAIIANDLDGRLRPLDGDGDGIAAFDMGAYEYRRLHVWLESSNPVSPYGTWATAATNIQDAIDAALPGDEIVVTNGVYETGGRTVVGTMTNRVVVDKPLMVRSVNGPAVTVIRGYQVPGATNGEGAVRCVYLTNGAVLDGFTLTNGATHASGDEFLEQSGGGVWCESTNATVTNCQLIGNAAEYGGGGAYGTTLNLCTLLTNRAMGSIGSGAAAYASALNDCTLSGNVAGHRGGGTFFSASSHCVFEGNSAVGYGGATAESRLDDCSLRGNSAEYGGGSYAGVLNRCALTGNSAGRGGGSYFGELNNCTLTSNSAEVLGGGAYNGTLNNCTVTGNSAEYGGGVAYGGLKGGPRMFLNNCVVYFNTAHLSGSNYPEESSRIVLSHCCTTPLPGNYGSFTNAPSFVDEAHGNFRLQSNSACINAGRNSLAPAGLDLDGNARIAGGTVDVGAYEFQAPQSAVSYAWLMQHGLPMDGSADSTDSDGDEMTNWHEWRAGTIPTNSLSLLRMLPLEGIGPDVLVSWQSSAGVSYFLERSTNLASPPLFTPIATNLIGQPGFTSFADPSAAGAPRVFYRVGVEQNH